VPAALLMARVIADIRFCVTSEPDPAKAVKTLNTLLQEGGFTEKFVTFALAALHSPDHTLTIVNAGHIPLLVRRAASGVMEEVAGGDLSGLPLGVLDNAEYQSVTIQLQPGDIAVLLTDGILDATNAAEDQFGSERIHQVLRSAPSSVKKACTQLLEAVDRFTAGHQQFDDITLVGIGRVE
jgi:sigma-B regulation protein RsbU (phosphoserine phosphatase)